MEESTRARIFTVMANVFGVPSCEVLPSTSQQTIEGWDSLAHVHLIMALEAEFEVSFSIEQALELTNVRAIYEALTNSVEVK